MIIENIEAECIGKNGYRCKSNNFFTQIYRANENNEVNIIEKLQEEGICEEKMIFLPFLLRAQSEEIIRVDFLLETYKRIFLKIKPISLKRQEIKEPETYQQLLQKAVIKIKINENQKSLLLEI